MNKIIKKMEITERKLNMLLKVAFNHGLNNYWEKEFNEWRNKTIQKIKEAQKNENVSWKAKRIMEK